MLGFTRLHTEMNSDYVVLIDGDVEVGRYFLVGGWGMVGGGGRGDEDNKGWCWGVCVEWRWGWGVGGYVVLIDGIMKLGGIVGVCVGVG